MSILPRLGDFIQLNGKDYIVNSIEWIEIYGNSSSKSEEIRPVISVKEIGEFEKTEDLKRKLEHTEEWYAVRLKALEDWARKNNHIEFFEILANGHLLKDPPIYAQQMNILKWKLEIINKDKFNG